MTTPIPTQTRVNTTFVPNLEGRRSGQPADHSSSRVWYTPMIAAVGNVRISVIIPALNEAENLPYVLPLIPEWVDEVLLVDGYSTDDTVEVARQVRPDIRIVYQQGKGKGAALRTGFYAATGDIIIHLDADGSTNPCEIPLFVGALLSGADYVKGSRFIQGAHTHDMTKVRFVGNSALVMLANVLFGTRFTDITYGYNAVWRRHAHLLALEINNWSNEIISNIRAARNQLRVVEVACIEEERIAGLAKLQTFSAGWEILKGMIRERFTALRPSAPLPVTAPIAPTLEMRPTLAEAEPLLERTIGEPLRERAVGGLE
jgi:glycosyltransferase involved in cell wall biosynthesis